MNRNDRGKLVSILIIIIFTVPVLLSVGDVYKQSVKGSFDDKRTADQNPLNINNINLAAVPKFNIDNFFTPSEFKKPNENPLEYKSEDNSDPFKTKRNSEVSSIDLQPINKKITINQPFEVKLIVKNQKEEALSSSYLIVKNSYDITLNNKKNTIFIPDIDPNLVDGKVIVINFDMAKRLGLEAKIGEYNAISLLKE